MAVNEEEPKCNEDEYVVWKRVLAFLIGIASGVGVIMGLAAFWKNSVFSDKGIATGKPQSQIKAMRGNVTSTQIMQRQLSFQSPQRNFYDIAVQTGTDKVLGVAELPECLRDKSQCQSPEAENPKCRVSHMYHTLYSKWLEPYSDPNAEPFQFLEIGFHKGRSFDAFQEFLPRAEMHSIDKACEKHGNAGKNKRFQEYLDTNKLHCANAGLYSDLQNVWEKSMKRQDAPPLKIVIDDASHMSHHMVYSMFYWFPKIEAGGIMVVEDIQPIEIANKFRTDFLPQIMKDLHYCGDKSEGAMKDRACFPTLWPLLKSIHCELHICVFERNDEPAVEFSEELTTPPSHALNGEECLLR